VWSDPEFDPSLHAFYYARAIEIPTPRWTTIQAHQLGVPIADTVPATVQERAWSSPIWYTPSEEERKKAKPGTSVADLLKSGGVALNDAELKALVVGKGLWVRNTVTGGIFKIIYDKAGQCVIYHVGRYAVLPSEVGNVYQAGYQGISSAYTIQNGKIVTTVADSPFEVTVYKVGDKHLAARSNEFGFANYEIMAQPPNNLVETGKEVHIPPEADKGVQ
jgi:hypothetical protein